MNNQNNSSAPSGWISDVIRDVAELPDRDSPSDATDMMLVTGDELRDIIAVRAPKMTADRVQGGLTMTDDQISKMWSDAGVEAMSQAGCTVGGVDAAYNLRPFIFARAILSRQSMMGGEARADAKNRRIQYLDGLVRAYGQKSLQYDIEHPNDGLNSTDPQEVERTQRGITAPQEQAEHDDLLAEAHAVFDLMLDGCLQGKFGDFENGRGETIGPRMDALHARFRALASTLANAAAADADGQKGEVA